MSFVLSSFVFAQDNLQENNVSSWTTALIDQLDLSKVHNNEINNVVLRFCNDWLEANQLSTKLDLKMRPNQKKDICVALINESSSSVNIVASVVPATLNDNWNIVCSNTGDLEAWLLLNNFSDFTRSFDLSSKEQLIKSFTLGADKSLSGNYYICFAVNLTEAQKLSDNSPFNLVIRKAGNIKINVSWSPYRFQWFDDIVSWVNKNTKQISISWMIACGLLLVLALIPSRKKANRKK